MQFACQFRAADTAPARLYVYSVTAAAAAASVGELNYKLTSALNAPHGVCVIHAENYKLSAGKCYLTAKEEEIGSGASGPRIRYQHPASSIQHSGSAKNSCLAVFAFAGGNLG